MGETLDLRDTPFWTDFGSPKPLKKHVKSELWSFNTGFLDRYFGSHRLKSKASRLTRAREGMYIGRETPAQTTTPIYKVPGGGVEGA